MPLWLRGLYAAAIALSAGQASAQSPASFYAGKTVTLVVGSTPGGYYDIAGRTIARHLGQFIPGKPAIIVQNQPRAAGIASLNRLGNIAELPADSAQTPLHSDAQLSLVWSQDDSPDHHGGSVVSVRAIA